MAPLAPDLRYKFFELAHGELGVAELPGASGDGSSRTETGYVVYERELRYLQQVLEYALEHAPLPMSDSHVSSDVGAPPNAAPDTPADAAAAAAAAAAETVPRRQSYYVPVSAELPWAPQAADKPRARVVLMGGNLVVHHFVCAVVALRQMSPELLERVDLNVYVVPTGRNDLAAFLARNDKWYRRQVYSAFSGRLPLCPQFPMSELTPELLHEACMMDTLPVQFISSSLQDMVRQSLQTLPVCIFECLCWRNTSATGAQGDDEGEGAALLNQQPPDVVVPFVMSAEIGIFTNAEAYRRRKGTPGTPLAEVVRSADFCPAGYPELFVSYIPSSMSGSIEAQGSIQRREVFASLTLTNLPDARFEPEKDRRAPDASIPNAPNMRWLVMHSCNPPGFNDTFRGAKHQTNTKRAEALLQGISDPDAQAPPAHVGVAEISAVNATDSFCIMLDGAVVGPVKRVRVQPCQGWSGGRAVIPISTHFPIVS